MPKTSIEYFMQKFEAELPVIRSRLEHLQLRRSAIDGFYEASYIIIKRKFDELSASDFDRRDMGACLILVYSWMGRPKPNLDAFFEHYEGQPSGAIARLLSDAPIECADLEWMLKCLGGSVVGMSKFLHFLNTSKFPMWDQHVARCFRENPYSDNSNAYRAYVMTIPKISLPADLMKTTKSILGNVTELRQKEFALFHLGISLPRNTIHK